MVIKGHFGQANYEYLSSGNSRNNGLVKVTIETYMEISESTRLQNALINRKEDAIRIQVTTAVDEEPPEIKTVPPTDKPSTETESW
jgi:hypothetical protein